MQILELQLWIYLVYKCRVTSPILFQNNSCDYTKSYVL